MLICSKLAAIILDGFGCFPALYGSLSYLFVGLPWTKDFSSGLIVINLSHCIFFFTKTLPQNSKHLRGSKVNKQMHVILLVNVYFSASEAHLEPNTQVKLRSDFLLHTRKLDESFQWRSAITDSGQHKLKVPHKFSRTCGA